MKTKTVNKPMKPQRFVLEVLNNEYGTWQGTLLRTDTQQKIPFRSLLELIRLIDSVVAQESVTEDGVSA